MLRQEIRRSIWKLVLRLYENPTQRQHYLVEFLYFVRKILYVAEATKVACDSRKQNSSLLLETPANARSLRVPPLFYSSNALFFQTPAKHRRVIWS